MSKLVALSFEDERHSSLMTLCSVALVKLPLRVFDALARADDPPNDGTFRVKTPDGEILGLRYLQDAALVSTPHRFGDDDQALTDLLWDVFGDDLADHDDDRGIFVFPSTATPRGDTYQRVLEEIGELGVWVSLGDDPDDATMDGRAALTDDAAAGDAAPTDFMSAVASIHRALGSDTLAALQHAMLSGDMGAFTRVQQRIAEQVAQRPELAAQLQGLMGMVPPELLQSAVHTTPREMMQQVQEALGRSSKGER